MRKTIAVVVVFIAFSLAATAQDYNKAEAFGGFQYTSFDTFNIQRSNLMGWDAQVTDYFNKPFGLTADVSGSYGSPNVGGFPLESPPGEPLGPCGPSGPPGGCTVML